MPEISWKHSRRICREERSLVYRRRWPRLAGDFGRRDGASLDQYILKRQLQGRVTFKSGLGTTVRLVSPEVGSLQLRDATTPLPNFPARYSESGIAFSTGQSLSLVAS